MVTIRTAIVSIICVPCVVLLLFDDVADVNSAFILNYDSRDAVYVCVNKVCVIFNINAVSVLFDNYCFSVDS